MVKKLLIYLCILTFLGCSIQSRKDQDNYRLLMAQKEYDTALSFLEESSLKKDELNKLLYLIERGSVEYMKQRFSKSSKTFYEANSLVDELYTKSVKEAIASSVLNDNSNSFYGSIFERSLIYHYQALSFYKLAQRGYKFEHKLIDGKSTEIEVNLSKNEIKKLKDQTRSTLIAWDSFFQNFSRQANVKTFLKQNLLAKLIAAKLHEWLGTRRDKSIALQLYKDSFDILNKIGPTFSRFNKKYKEYNLELREFFDRDRNSLSKSNIVSTDSYKELSEHLKFKIISLSRSSDRRRLISRYRPNKDTSLKLKQKKANVSFILESSFIEQLKGEDFSFNLRSAIDNVEDPDTRRLIRSIGVPIITYFAMGPLGLGSVSRSGNVTVYTRHNVGEVITEEVGLEFELPNANVTENKDKKYLEFYKDKKLVKRVPLTLLSSLSDYAFINSQELIANSFKSRASRVGVKYVAAIIAAYTTYKSLQENSGELFAKPAAITQFLVSQKAIKESEKADLRHWSSLPDEILNTEIYLNEGKYSVKLSVEPLEKTSPKRYVSLGNITVKKNEQNLFTYRSI